MNTKTACAVILGAAFLVIFIALIVSHVTSVPAVMPVSVGTGAALWKDRTYEAMLQGIIILAGVMAILLLLGLKQSGKVPP